MGVLWAAKEQFLFGSFSRVTTPAQVDEAQ